LGHALERRWSLGERIEEVVMHRFVRSLLASRCHAVVGLALGLVASLAGTPGAMASPEFAMLTLSASDTDPYVVTSSPWVGEQTLYVWNHPSIVDTRGSEFGLSGTLTVIDLATRPGVTNSGTSDSPILTYEECTYSAVIAEVRVVDAVGAGGTLGFGPSTQSGKNCSDVCAWDRWESHIYQNFASDGTVPTDGRDSHPDCAFTVSVDPGTWGRIKASYR
jgi:hypothetical protein